MSVSIRKLRVVVFVWSLVAVAGVLVVGSYEFRAEPLGPGVEDLKSAVRQVHGPVAEHLPARWRLQYPDNRSGPVGIVFLHPHCPCSRATIAELTRFGRISSEGTVFLVMFHSSEMSESWNNTDLTNAAGRVPDAQVIRDTDAAIARAFGVRVSGESLAFDALGVRRYHGGLTASRGHEGTNPGIRAFSRVLQGAEPTRETHPAFGCLIDDTGTANDHHTHSHAGS